MQLVAYGAQDVYLTGDPQITYFKVVYRRHTNFSMECIEQTFSGSPTAGNTASATISRNGDLIGAMHLQYERKNAVTDIGEIVSQVSVEIGGQLIDKHYGNWLDIWDALSSGQNKTKGSLIGASASGCETGSTCYIPLQFWFNRNAGLALPLIALQYHEVKVNVTFADASTKMEGDASLWVDYIYLDTEERKRFAQMSHEYLIDQVQKNTTPSSNTSSHRLNFNHPVKELVIGKKDEYAAHSVDGPMKLTLNGHDRFAARSVDYFSKLQPYYHHTTMAAYVLVYSFALRPEEHQPSGTCNFSRIDNAELSADELQNIDIFAVNYNVLRVVSGMGGLAYSN